LINVGKFILNNRVLIIYSPHKNSSAPKTDHLKPLKKGFIQRWSFFTAKSFWEWVCWTIICN